MKKSNTFQIIRKVLVCCFLSFGGNCRESSSITGHYKNSHKSAKTKPNKRLYIFWNSHRFVVFLQKQNNHENEAITINHDAALPDYSRSYSPDLQAGE